MENLVVYVNTSSPADTPAIRCIIRLCRAGGSQSGNIPTTPSRHHTQSHTHRISRLPTLNTTTQPRGTVRWPSATRDFGPRLTAVSQMTNICRQEPSREVLTRRNLSCHTAQTRPSRSVLILNPILLLLSRPSPPPPPRPSSLAATVL